ncbi:MAG: ArnT family glycosyltransferase [Vicinamibacterales bacterium]
MMPPSTALHAPRASARVRFALALLAVIVLAGLLRGAFPTADPPSQPTVGIVWHDEGAWVHNARNRVLFGSWRMDEWNPMYLTPVLTGLEYASFRLFGVGLWQARLVSQVAGVISVALLGLGVARLGGRRAGFVAALLAATNYVYVMYDRAALIEAAMVAFLVAAWYSYVRAGESPRWGIVAATCAVIAFFTKASAVFFLAALALDSLLQITTDNRSLPEGTARTASPRHRPLASRAAMWTLVGLAAAGTLGFLFFVLPNWHEYRFYNWRMSVTRRPSYTLRALVDRASWFPIVHDFFTRMWMATLLAVSSVLGALPGFGRRQPGERLLALWLGLGVAELLARDVGNERYFLCLVPAILALASLLLCRDRRMLPSDLADKPLGRALVAAPLVFFALYVLAGALVRLAFIYQVRPGVRLGAAVAVSAGILIYATWPRLALFLSRDRWSPGAAVALALIVAAGDLAQYGQWAAGRSYKNHAAMKRIAELLPPGTLVHGKLANGLSLESRIRPIFVGQNFGNYEDRLVRDDIRYLLTYTSPALGYEGRVIRDVLEAYPHWKVLATFEVCESAGGLDVAALVDKMPAGER